MICLLAAAARMPLTGRLAAKVSPAWSTTDTMQVTRRASDNASAAAVVAKVAAAPYAAAFVSQFGAGSLGNVAQAFNQIGLAIQAYEQAPRFQPFTSKYDAVVTGRATFSAG